MVKEYWYLIGREPFLAITWELDFCQACSFRKMLMNHKNFHFTQIPDKTNDAIFLKSPKTMFWGHFWPFLPDGDFSKKTSFVIHNYIWAPNTMLCFKKTNELISRKLTDRWKDGWKDGRTDPSLYDPYGRGRGSNKGRETFCETHRSANWSVFLWMLQDLLDH